MPLFRRPRLFRRSGSSFEVNLAPEARAWIVELADQLEQLLDGERDDTRRLYPTAYPDDAERDAGYQVLAREQLADHRREAIAVMRATVDRDQLSGDELSAWMHIVNDLRLVLGTRLDVSEDDVEPDPEADDFEAHLLYHQLGLVLSEIVDALTGALPPPQSDR